MALLILTQGRQDPGSPSVTHRGCKDSWLCKEGTRLLVRQPQQPHAMLGQTPYSASSLALLGRVNPWDFSFLHCPLGLSDHNFNAANSTSSPALMMPHPPRQDPATPASGQPPPGASSWTLFLHPRNLPLPRSAMCSLSLPLSLPAEPVSYLSTRRAGGSRE
jgi:hypothetical protein